MITILGYVAVTYMVIRMSYLEKQVHDLRKKASK